MCDGSLLHEDSLQAPVKEDLREVWRQSYTAAAALEGLTVVSWNAGIYSTNLLTVTSFFSRSNTNTWCPTRLSASAVASPATPATDSINTELVHSDRSIPPPTTRKLIAWLVCSGGFDFVD